MTLFDITFTNTMFASEENPGGLEICEIEAAAFTEVSLAEGTFPKGVVAFLKGSISDGGDDDDSDGDYKYTVSVTLRLEAEDENAARNVSAPSRLLSLIVDSISGDFSGDIESTWDVDEVEKVETAGQANA